MREIYEVIGEAEFFKRLDEFDEHNMKVIRLYEHHAENLKKYLPESAVGLVSELSLLPGILYWRKV